MRPIASEARKSAISLIYNCDASIRILRIDRYNRRR